MKLLRLSFLPIVTILLVIPGTTGTVTVSSRWQTGFTAHVSVPTDVDLVGWRVIVTFDLPVSSVSPWNAIEDSNSADNMQYTFHNIEADWNKIVNAGGTINFGFNGVTSDGFAITLAAVIEGSSAPPPPSATTSTTTASPPSSATTSATTAAPPSAGYDYADVLHKSILFYEAQRSGALPASNRVSWRGDSALDDGQAEGHDLSGGWYDAGDHVKFGFPMAGSVTVLAWGGLEFWDGYAAAGELQNFLDSIKWPLDYFIKAHIRNVDGTTDKFFGQCGSGHIDHAYWGRPEDMTMSRPCWYVNPSSPGSDLTAETAAAMAASSLVFRKAGGSANVVYADLLLDNAKQLYEFAYHNRGKYSDSIPDAADFYRSWSGYEDELLWGAAWLFKATNNATYLTLADSLGLHASFTTEFAWDDKHAGAQLLMKMHSDSCSSCNSYDSIVDDFLNSWLSKSTTPNGMIYYSTWGNLRYVSNAVFLAAVAAKHESNSTKANNYRNFATTNINFILGDGGRSFVVGFGNNPPQRSHHRSSSCPVNMAETCDWNDYNSAAPNPAVVEGALVGGPDGSDVYVDDRSDYVKNEVTTDYNAGFQSAVAAVYEYTLS